MTEHDHDPAGMGAAGDVHDDPERRARDMSCRGVARDVGSPAAWERHDHSFSQAVPLQQQLAAHRHLVGIRRAVRCGHAHGAGDRDGWLCAAPRPGRRPRRASPCGFARWRGRSRGHPTGRSDSPARTRGGDVERRQGKQRRTRQEEPDERRHGGSTGRLLVHCCSCHGTSLLPSRLRDPCSTPTIEPTRPDDCPAGDARR